MERALGLCGGLPQLASERGEREALEDLDAVEGHSIETGTRAFLCAWESERVAGRVGSH